MGKHVCGSINNNGERLVDFFGWFFCLNNSIGKSSNDDEAVWNEWFLCGLHEVCSHIMTQYWPTIREALCNSLQYYMIKLKLFKAWFVGPSETWNAVMFSLLFVVKASQLLNSEGPLHVICFHTLFLFYTGSLCKRRSSSWIWRIPTFVTAKK